MVDARRRLRAAAFMEIAQELAGKGADQLHMSDRDLSPLGAVWVLARMRAVFGKMPVQDQKVTLGTWHKGLSGIQYLRDYTVTDSSGSVLVSSTSSWVIMRLGDRRMLRPDVLGSYVPSEPQCGDDALADPCAKILLPKGMGLKTVGKHTVVYSDVDYNGHTNNTKYVVWALDALPRDLVLDTDLLEMEINFSKESHIGDTVTLHAASDGKNWYVEGRAEDGLQCFIVRFVFNGNA